jgi:MFS family permease
MSSLFDKSRITVGGQFNRWLVPPAAIAIHLCIGMAYGLSVFWLPLSKALGVSQGLNAPIQCASDVGFFQELFITTCDWRVSTLVWVFTIGIVFLGLSAALWGSWLERVGPRKAGLISACCWSGGMLMSAYGISIHQFWIVLLGTGVIGGIGLGIGYISPVSTLIKWFPDKRGMATGMAIMGFGGGAMIGSPLAAVLMKAYASANSVGVVQTFVVLGVIYFIYMTAGAFMYRIPASDWAPKGWTPKPANTSNAMITHKSVHVKDVWSIPQFWLVWMVLCMNVSAGIGVISMASPMLQEVFAGELIGSAAKFSELDKAELTAVAGIAAGFTALISFFNIIGRFIWASMSDWLGRRATYTVFFLLGGFLYASVPSSASALSLPLFVGAFCIILSMYGGGFATVPAYLADLFGTKMVGAIHGRLLTAWATAGVLGPYVVTYMRDYQLSLGIPKAQVYNQTMYILVGMLLVGWVCNLCIKPLNSKWFMDDDTTGQEKEAVRPVDDSSHQPRAISQNSSQAMSSVLALVLAWAMIGLPLAWGVYKTYLSALKLF